MYLIRLTCWINSYWVLIIKTQKMEIQLPHKNLDILLQNVNVFLKISIIILKS